MSTSSPQRGGQTTTPSEPQNPKSRRGDVPQARLERELAQARQETVQAMQHYARAAVALGEIRRVLPSKVDSIGDRASVLTSKIRSILEAQEEPTVHLARFEREVLNNLVRRWANRHIEATTGEAVLRWLRAQRDRVSPRP